MTYYPTYAIAGGSAEKDGGGGGDGDDDGVEDNDSIKMSRCS